MLIIYPYICYIGLYCTISSYTGFATRDDVYDVIANHNHNHNPCLHSCHTWRNNNSVELIRYRHRRPTYLLVEWSRYATSFSPLSNHRPTGNTAGTGNTNFQRQTSFRKICKTVTSGIFCYSVPHTTECVMRPCAAMVDNGRVLSANAVSTLLRYWHNKWMRGTTLCMSCGQTDCQSATYPTLRLCCHKKSQPFRTAQWRNYNFCPPPANIRYGL